MSRVRHRNVPAEDPLDLLLEGGCAEDKREVSRLVQFFRILAADVAGLEEQAESLDDEQVQVLTQLLVVPGQGLAVGLDVDIELFPGQEGPGVDPGHHQLNLVAN